MVNQNIAVGNLVMLGSQTVTEDLECCDCADDTSVTYDCVCEDL